MTEAETSGAAASERVSGIASHHQKLEEPQNDPPLEAQEERGPAGTLSADFQPPEL